jgi:hypothetical protein
MICLLCFANCQKLTTYQDKLRKLTQSTPTPLFIIHRSFCQVCSVIWFYVIRHNIKLENKKGFQFFRDWKAFFSVNLGIIYAGVSPEASPGSSTGTSFGLRWIFSE